MADAGEFATFGQQAFDGVARRFAVLFLGTVALGLPWTPVRSDPVQLLLAEGVLLGLIAIIALALTRHLRWPALLAMLLVAGAGTAFVAGAVTPGSYPAQVVGGWLIAGVAGAVATAKGPVPGGAAFLATAAGASWGSAADCGARVVMLLGAFTFLSGASLARGIGRRSFALAEHALARQDELLAAAEVAEQRRLTRLESDRRLHDTVLVTLTLLAHRSRGVADEAVRQACRTDAALLRSGRLTDRVDPREADREPGPGVHHSGEVEDTLGAVVAQARARAATLGLTMRIHGSRAALASRGLTAAAAQALTGALSECLVNVQRHAGVSEVELLIEESAADASLLLLDHGRGFDPATTSEECLGLRRSVQERLAQLGGAAIVWSRPGAGTTVLLRVPRGGEGA
jgi:signal transduction histidine kinase